eukprot:11202908-Lingulodinium_polyedra.AAC.1
MPVRERWYHPASIAAGHGESLWLGSRGDAAAVNGHIVQSDAGAWAALPRVRMLLSTFPAARP